MKRFLSVILGVLVGSGMAVSDDIFGAAEKGDLKEVAALLKENPELAKASDRGMPPKDNYTALHYAAMKGHKEIAELLLANRAAVNA